MKEKKVRILDVVLITLILLTVVFCVYYITIGGINETQQQISSSKNKKDINRQIDRVEELLYRLDDKYIGEIDYDKLGSGALAGIMAMVDDPYTRYLTEKEIQDELTPNDEDYVGIGITAMYMEEKTAGILISISPESPAANGGLWVGDLLKKVDDFEVKDQDTYEEAMDKLRGKEGESVKVTVLRDDAEKTFTIVRKKIKARSTSSNIIDNKYGYIRIYSFDYNTFNEFKKEYDSLKAKKIKKLIIDLRNNGGGIVSESTNIADLLAPDGEVLLETRYKNDVKQIVKTKDGNETDMDVLLLVNDHSASASEILASSLRDLGVAKLLGEKTYGKGIIQQYSALSAGDGTSITFGEYFTKSGKKINKVGLSPDYSFVNTDLEKRLIVSTKDNDSMIRKAIEILGD